MDDQEQYHRRLCLRIEGIPAAEQSKGDSAEQWLAKVKQMFEKVNASVPDNVIDKAHGIGNRHQMTVRFTTWRNRTPVYRARKKPKSPYKIRLDLTKKRLNTVISTNDILKLRNLAFLSLTSTVDFVRRLVISFTIFRMKRISKASLHNWIWILKMWTVKRESLTPKKNMKRMFDSISEEWIFKPFCPVVF